MTFRDWDKLLYGIERCQCILFLGRELPLLAPEGERQDPTRSLSEKLMERLAVEGEEGPPPGPDSLARIAQQYLVHEDEVGLEMEVERWHEGLSDRVSTLHDDLAALPFPLIVTSSHDPLMESALVRAGKSPAVEHYHYRGRNRELLAVPRVEAPVLFHLYGHVREAPSVVLTETQLLDYLANLISRDPPLPNDLNAALTNGRFFLFLGFGLGQWYLRILLHVLKVLRQGRSAFAIEGPSAVAPTEEDSILFYRKNFKVQIYQEDVLEFVRELKSRYEPARVVESVEGAAAGASPATSSFAGAAEPPKVFVCHASPDAEKARTIHDGLKRAGFEPWLDKESLRGGDRWDAQIETTIQKVDYFVVLNSRALAAKSKEASYVNKEIKVAIRAEDWRMGSFIIPVMIDDAELLEPLAPYHSIDLTRKDGLRELVRSIKRLERA